MTSSGAAAGEGRRFVRNALSAYGSQALLALSVLIVTPVLFRGLGTAGFGTWSVVLAFATVYALVEFGFGRGVARLVAESLGRGRQRDLDDVVGASTAIFCALGVLCSASAVAAAFAADGLASAPLRGDFRTSMLILAGERLAYAPTAGAYAALQGYERYDLKNLIGSINTLVFTVGSVLAIVFDAGIVGVTVAFCAAHLLQGVLAVVLLRKLSPELDLRPRLRAAEARGRVIGQSSYVLFAESMTFISQRMDTLVIASVRSAAAAGPYAAALKLQSGVQSLTLPIVYQLMPMTSGLWARGRAGEVSARLVLATRAALQLSLPVAAALALFAGDVVDLWLGKGAPDVTAEIIVVLMGIQVLLLVGAAAEQILVGIGRVRTVGMLSLVEGPANLALSIVLVRSYGAIGAALGTLCTSGVIGPLKLPLAARALGASVSRVAARSLVPAVASNLPALAVMVAVRLLLGPGAARFVVGTALGLAVAAAVGVAQLGPGRVRTFIRAARSAGPQAVTEP